MRVKVVMKNKVDDLLRLQKLFDQGFVSEKEKNDLKKEILKSKHIYWNRSVSKVTSNLKWISDLLKDVLLKLSKDDVISLVHNLQDSDFCEQFKTLRKEKEHLPVLIKEEKVVDSKGLTNWKLLSTGDLPIPRYYKKFRFTFNNHKFLVYSCWYKNAEENSNNRKFFEDYINTYISSKSNNN